MTALHVATRYDTFYRDATQHNVTPHVTSQRNAMSSVELTPDQRDAEEAVDDFIVNPSSDRPYFVLHGLAGTGKTWLWSRLANRHRGAILCTPTGKAANVLRKRSGLTVETVHSVIYDFKGLVDDAITDRKNPIFVSKVGLDLKGRVVFLDECSMVGGSLANDLLATGARIVACGDPGQLPPVMDTQFFVNPDAELTQIHRQAETSPIIRQAHQVRTTGHYEPDGPDFRVVDFAEPEDLLAADVLLCWMNVTRKKLNRKKRRLLGLAGPLKRGEPVMCLKNDHARRIQNGAIYRLREDRKENGPLVIEDDDGREVFVPKATVEGEKSFDVQRYSDSVVPFAAAYASTVHKAQGSEFESVLVLDEHPRGPGRISFLYTAITRSIDRCTVVSWR